MARKTVPKKSNDKILGIVSLGDSLYLYKKEKNSVGIYKSTDGNTFKKSQVVFSINDLTKKKLDPLDVEYLRVSQHGNSFEGVIGFHQKHYFATSKDAVLWNLRSEIPKVTNHAVVPAGYTYEKQTVAYLHTKEFHIGFSTNGTWQVYDDPLYDPHLAPDQSLMLLGSMVGQSELFIPFVVTTTLNTSVYHSLSVAVFQKENPRKIAWRLKHPIWSSPEEIVDKNVVPIGIVAFKKMVYSYWVIDGEIRCVPHALLSEMLFDKKSSYAPYQLKKSEKNPILTPNAKNKWESQAVFNPAALYDDEKVHLVYRAVGDDWVSRFGYTSSNDGIHVGATSLAYVPRESFEGVWVTPDPNSPFASGPGLGGCEDPRLTKIGNKVYLTYVAYNGITGPRVAFSSIDYNDFQNNKWDWSPPVLISKPDSINKNACIFPEQIQGKYAVLHRVFPDILFDFVDTLDFTGENFLEGQYKIPPRRFGWDSRKVGAGPPPIKTKYGWLLIYHAVDDKNDGKYQIGAMLLDLHDPTKVLHRSVHPIISPTHWYENDGYKSGVVYPCGAIIKDETLFIYYGGSDSYVCVATAPIDEFLHELTQKETIAMQHVFLHA